MGKFWQEFVCTQTSCRSSADLLFHSLISCCRGVFTPFVCDHKDDRIAAVGKKLAEGEFDIVMLEEAGFKDNV